MSILVSGSAGHLGEAIVRTLRRQGQPVIGLDIKRSPFTDRVGSILDSAFVGVAMRGVSTVVHTATLHKPHIATHSMQDFIDTNVTGTLRLLEAAAAVRVRAFVYTSTTSAFGSALTPAAEEPAAWVTEEVPSLPRNIYGTSKLMAEQLCELFFRSHRLPVIILRTSRFFPEQDDNPDIRTRFDAANAQANELTYRRLDIEDAVGAHLLAVREAHRIGFARYIVSATSPFKREDLRPMREQAPAVLRRHFPEYERIYAARGWRFFDTLDRVYVNERACRELGWRPRFDFGYVLGCLDAGRDFRSSLALEVGSKGYHDTVFEHGPYPTPMHR